MVLSRVRLIRVRLVLVNLNPINDTYIGEKICNRNLKYMDAKNNANNQPLRSKSRSVREGKPTTRAQTAEWDRDDFIPKLLLRCG